MPASRSETFPLNVSAKVVATRTKRLERERTIKRGREVVFMVKRVSQFMGALSRGIKELFGVVGF